ncbi:MAG TPA: DUF2249 domain-containing protein [Candidatus Limnocylindrales bacterium]
MAPETPRPIVLDVRPTIAAGADPFEEIMAAAENAIAGQDLVIVNSFEPFPLYDRLAALGFDHRTERLPDGDWRVTFRRD